MKVLLNQVIAFSSFFCSSMVRLLLFFILSFFSVHSFSNTQSSNVRSSNLINDSHLSRTDLDTIIAENVDSVSFTINADTESRRLKNAVVYQPTQYFYLIAKRNYDDSVGTSGIVSFKVSLYLRKSFGMFSTGDIFRSQAFINCKNMKLEFDNEYLETFLGDHVYLKHDVQTNSLFPQMMQHMHVGLLNLICMDQKEILKRTLPSQVENYD